MEKQNEFSEALRKANLILNDPVYLDTLREKLCVYHHVTEELGDVERYNTQKDLSILYGLVDNFAKASNLRATTLMGHQWYEIKYNDYIFNITMRKEKDGSVTYECYHTYTDECNLPYCVNIDDIKTWKLIDINELNIGLVANFRDTIKFLNNEGFSLDFIKQLVDEVTESIRTGNKSHQRKH